MDHSLCGADKPSKIVEFLPQSLLHSNRNNSSARSRIDANPPSDQKTDEVAAYFNR